MFLSAARAASQSCRFVCAQAAPAAARGVAGKVGVLNVRGAIGNWRRQASFHRTRRSIRFSTDELENMNKQINDIRQRLQANEGKLSPEEGARLQRQGESLQKQMQRKQEDYQEDVNAAQQDVIERIGRKMMDVLDRYARENAYTAIFDSSAQGAPIYVSNGIDVTADIVKLYDQAYPAKASATPAKPAAAKPAAAAPAPKP
jgi:outer membrane protein